MNTLTKCKNKQSKQWNAVMKSYPEYLTLVTVPDMVAVAILHVWNRKYGPQVSLVCNVEELKWDIYNKN